MIITFYMVDLGILVLSFSAVFFSPSAVFGTDGYFFHSACLSIPSKAAALIILRI